MKSAEKWKLSIKWIFMTSFSTECDNFEEIFSFVLQDRHCAHTQALKDVNGNSPFVSVNFRVQSIASFESRISGMCASLSLDFKTKLANKVSNALANWNRCD